MSEAQHGYQNVLHQHPNHPPALHFLGVVALTVGNFLDAVDLISKAILYDPDYAAAHSNLGNAYQSQGKSEEAIECYNNAISINPEYAIAHLNLGITLLEIGRLSEASDSFQFAITVDPEYAAAYKNLSMVYNRFGQLDKAVECLEKSLAIFPDDTDAHNDLGVILLSLGRLDEALTCFQEAIKLRPDDSRLYLNLGNLFHERGDLERAIENYNSAISISPSFAGCHCNLGNVFLDQGKIDEAIASYEEAISFRPDYAKAYMNLGNASRENGDTAQAIENYEKAISIDSGYSEAFLNLGKILAKLDRPAEAIEAFENALAIKPDFLDAQISRDSQLHKQVADWHFPMMNDAVRNDAFEAALKLAVKPDSVVLDIGTGSGLLALFAARIGAQKVEAVEMVTPIAQVAEKIIRINGYEDVIKVHNKISTDLKVGSDLPIKANILVTETFDAGLLGENAIRTIKHARANLLTDDAVIIPQRAVVTGALIESDEIFKMGKVNDVSGFDLSPFNVFRKPYYQIPINSHVYKFISEDVVLFEFDFTGKFFDLKTKMFSILPTHIGECHGVVFWFKLFLDDTEYYDTAADKSHTNHWKQAVHILDSPIAVNPDKKLDFVARHNDNTISFSFTSE